MQNLAQILLMSQCLEKQKADYLRELQHVNSMLHKKRQSITKMQAYQRDYQDEKKYMLSKTVPCMTRNKMAFLKKIHIVLEKTQQEIKQIETTKNTLLHRISIVDQKINMMKLWIDKLNHKALLKENSREQNRLDDFIGRG